MVRRSLAMAVAALAMVPLGAREITKVLGDIVVRVADADAEFGKPQVVIQRTGALGPATVDLANNTAVVNDILFLGSDRVAVWGKLSAVGRDDVLTLIDVKSAVTIDTVWMRDAALSPNGRTVVYQYRTPDSLGQTVLQVALVAYDLTATPAINTTPGASRVDFAGRGIILYPEANRSAQRYWILLRQGEDAACKQPEHGFISPIAWSADSKRIAVVERAAGESRLVVVDISRGLRQPSVAAIPIPRDRFLQSRFLGAIPSEYTADVYPVFKEVNFTEDGRSITLKSWGIGPFAEAAATLAVPSADR